VSTPHEVVVGAGWYLQVVVPLSPSGAALHGAGVCPRKLGSGMTDHRMVGGNRIPQTGLPILHHLDRLVGHDAGASGGVDDVAHGIGSKKGLIELREV
jgi:hypothetical protein